MGDQVSDKWELDEVLPEDARREFDRRIASRGLAMNGRAITRQLVEDVLPKREWLARKARTWEAVEMGAWHDPRLQQIASMERHGGYGTREQVLIGAVLELTAWANSIRDAEIKRLMNSQPLPFVFRGDGLER